MGPFAGSQGVALLPAPKISLSSPFSVFARGEWIWLACRAQTGQNVLRFYFYRREGENQWTTYREQGESSLWISTTDLKSKESFACSYTVLDNTGNRSASPRSNSVDFSVIEPPEAPTLSLVPLHPFYILGEEVTLKCSASEEKDVARYRFSKEQKGLWKLFGEGKGPHEAFQVDAYATGQYSCRYWIRTREGQEIKSLGSNTVPIVVKDPPPAPELTVESSSGVVQEGDTLLIMCSSNGNHAKKIFHFYQDGAEINSTNKGSLKSSNVSLSISLQAQPNHTGEFACRYEERMNGRWIMSSWSQRLNITVSSSIQNSYTAWWAASFMILLMIPFVFCSRRKKSVSKSHQECEPGDNKENRERCQRLESKVPTDGDLQGPEVAYAHLSFSSAPTFAGPVMESGVPYVEEEGVMYSEILLRPIKRAEK
ncbi:uncharacterized protein LOC121932965 isoform X2 [Sceloporus undulatus]|nr:uncharacterized protein LOC121932965 isoform X2 [Sceloporus undulatus]